MRYMENYIYGLMQTRYYTVTCTGGTRDEMTGSSSDDWILLVVQLQPLLVTIITLSQFHTFYNHSSH
jgi:hypothetical protein